MKNGVDRVETSLNTTEMVFGIIDLKRGGMREDHWSSPLRTMLVEKERREKA